MHVLSPHAGAPHHVKFSADSLFHSPQHPSVGSKHRRQSAVAGDVSALLLQEESMVAPRNSATDEHGSDNRVAGTSDRNAQREEEEIETLDEPSYARNNTSHHAAVSTSDPVTQNQHNMHNRSQNASIVSDFSLNNISLMSDHPGINTSIYGHAHTPYAANYTHNNPQYRATPSTAGAYSTYPSAYDNSNYANSSTTSAGVREFGNISDGGYHEGYWRAKYARSTKQ